MYSEHVLYCQGQAAWQRVDPGGARGELRLWTQRPMSDGNAERATWLCSERPTKYAAWENWDLDIKGG